MNVNLKGLFTPQAVAAHMGALPPLKTTIMDVAFTDRKDHPFPTIGIAELKQVTGAIPLVKRAGRPISIDGDTAGVSFYAPLPIMPSIDVTAAELNDLQLIFPDQAKRSVWVSNKIDQLRRITRETTEAIASVVLTTGKYSWMVQLDGGKTGTFEIDYGTPLTVPVSTMWGSAKLIDVYDLLDDMDEAIQENGFGGDVVFMAGKTAFGKLLELGQGWAASAPQNAPIAVKLSDGCVDIGGYKVQRMTERYYNPATEGQVRKIADDTVVGFTKDSNAGVKYCSIDSISANNAATSFHIHTEEIGDRAIRLTAQCKPVPVRSPKSICKVKVI